MTPAEFSVLFVCTANHCRSPILERQLRHSIERTWPLHSDSWVVRSAGVQAKVAEPMHQFAATVLDDAGTDSSGFAGTALSATLVREADLILTADRTQRSAVVQLAPMALHYTFTARQFARITDRLEPFEASDLAEAGERLLSRALLMRSKLQPVTAAEDALTDPMCGPLTGFEAFAVHSQKIVDSICDRSTWC